MSEWSKASLRFWLAENTDTDEADIKKLYDAGFDGKDIQETDFKVLTKQLKIRFNQANRIIEYVKRWNGEEELDLFNHISNKPEIYNHKTGQEESKGDHSQKRTKNPSEFDAIVNRQKVKVLKLDRKVEYRL